MWEFYSSKVKINFMSVNKFFCYCFWVICIKDQIVQCWSNRKGLTLKQVWWSYILPLLGCLFFGDYLLVTSSFIIPDESCTYYTCSNLNQILITRFFFLQQEMVPRNIESSPSEEINTQVSKMKIRYARLYIQFWFKDFDGLIFFRALDDIRESIEELKFYRKTVFK